MSSLNDKEIIILKFLQLRKVAFPVNYIAKRTEMSWETAEYYLESLEQDGYVVRIDWNGKDRWKFNFEKYKKLTRKYR